MKKKPWNRQQIGYVLALAKKKKTRSVIAKEYNAKFREKRSADSIKHCIETYSDGIPSYIKDQPKVLIFDIETAPILAHVWGLWDQNVGLSMIERDWHCLSWAAKWLGDSPDDVMYEDQSKIKDMEDDSKMLKGIWRLLDEADVVITHNGISFDQQNGISFDQKKLNARFILNGMKPPSSYRHIDTLRIAKKIFKFTSNKLEYMSNHFNVKFKKLTHAKFSGFSLWKECMKGNKEAWKEMKEYNMYDVLSLEELYEKLIPWDDTINFNVYHEDDVHVCKCGSIDFVKAGFQFTNTAKFQKHRCKLCGTIHRDKENLLSKAKKKSLKTHSSKH